MKALSSRDQVIKANLDKYVEFYIIITDENTGHKTYRILTNLYCDPFRFIDIKGNYENCIYLSVNKKQFFNRFGKYKTLFIEHNNSLGFDRVIYKAIMK